MSKIFKDRSFLIHFTVYVAVNIMLIVIDLNGSPDKIWFFWPLLGWGIGILGHAAAIHFDEKKKA